MLLQRMMLLAAEADPGTYSRAVLAVVAAM